MVQLGRTERPYLNPLDILTMWRHWRELLVETNWDTMVETSRVLKNLQGHFTVLSRRLPARQQRLHFDRPSAELLWNLLCLKKLSMNSKHGG